jgi:hypothetical protein
MMRQLFLHIGYPKTGTTSLQRFLAANQAALAAQGVLYPRAGRLGDAHYGVNFALDIAAYDRPAELAVSADIGAEIAAEAAAAGADRVVVSSEYFATCSTEDRVKVRRAFGGFDLRVVCYLRRHDDALESAYAQAVKSVAAPPWRTSAESYVLHALGLGTVSYDYLGVLRQWAHQLGTPSVIVRPYERAQNQPDIEADFLRTIGVADGPGFVRQPRANPSIGPRTAAAIHLVRRTGLTDAAKRAVAGRLIEADARAPSAAHYLPAVLRESLVRRHLPMYRVIAREFMGSDAPLFTGPRPDDRDAWQPEDGFSTETLVETILLALLPPAPA